MTVINSIIVQYLYQQVKLMKFQSVKNYWDRMHCLLGGFSDFYHVAKNISFCWTALARPKQRYVTKAHLIYAYLLLYTTVLPYHFIAAVQKNWCVVVTRKFVIAT